MASNSFFATLSRAQSWKYCERGGGRSIRGLRFEKIWMKPERKSVNLSKTSWPDSLDGPQYIAKEDCQTEMIHKSTLMMVMLVKIVLIFPSQLEKERKTDA